MRVWHYTNNYIFKKREENIMTDGHRYTVPAAKHLRTFIKNTNFNIVFDKDMKLHRIQGPITKELKG